jgi:hypothetical protein
MSRFGFEADSQQVLVDTTKHTYFLSMLSRGATLVKGAGFGFLDVGEFNSAAHLRTGAHSGNLL